MIIKASAALRNDYASISNLAKESNEPIYITKNGEGDMVLYQVFDGIFLMYTSITCQGTTG